MTTRKYDKTRLDLQYKNKNETLEFYISDTETSDFYIRLTRANMPIEVNDLIIVLCVIDPNNQVRSQFVNTITNKSGVIYCELDNSMKSQVGTYQAKVMLVYEDEKIVTDTFTYTVKNDMFVALSQEIIADERFEILNDMLSEISRIKNQEEDRVVAENGRVATMTRIENEIAQLTLDINTKIDSNVTENTNKTDELVLCVNTKVDELVLGVNTKVDNSLNLNTSSVNELVTKGDNILSGIELNSNQLIASIDEYKNNAVENIETYKVNKDSEINQSLSNYKATTTESVNSFIEGESLKLRNDITLDNNTNKESLNAEFNKLDSDLKLNVNDFVADRGIYIDNYLQNKSLELTKYISDKNAELNKYVNDKNTELTNYINSKTTELNTYKTTKNAEINKYISDKDTELNNTEKTRNANESRRETNEYSRGLNENTRKSAEDKRISSFAQMTIDFNNMIKYNNDTINNKYDDIESDGTTITMKANGVAKKTITLSTSGGGGEGHTHTNKATLDKITESKLTSWDNKVDSVVGKGLSENNYTTEEKMKLDGIEENANNYTHPLTHSPDIILQDSNNRFVSDIEKSKWNNKSNFSGSYDDLSNKPVIPTITNDLTSALKTNYDTAYTHSQSSHAPSTAQKNSDITKEEIEAKLTGVISTHSHEGTSSSGSGEKLLYRYVYDANKVIQPTSLNLATGVFTTSSPHGLVEDDKLILTINYETEYDVTWIPYELFLIKPYYKYNNVFVKVVSPTEFSLKKYADKSDILFTNSKNINVNVSKFKFESLGSTTLTLTDMPISSKNIKINMIMTNGVDMAQGTYIKMLNNTKKFDSHYYGKSNYLGFKIVPWADYSKVPIMAFSFYQKIEAIVNINDKSTTTTINILKGGLKTVLDADYVKSWRSTVSSDIFSEYCDEGYSNGIEFTDTMILELNDVRALGNNTIIEIYDLGGSN